MSEFTRTEQEEKCDALFRELMKAYKKLDKLNNPEKVSLAIKDINTKLKEAKALVKDFEKEARADNMPAAELKDRRHVLVSELNGLIEMKKKYSQTDAGRADLFSGGKQSDTEITDGMSQQALMQRGRKQISETDAALNRGLRLVNDTLDVGKNTAGTLHDQTGQLNKIMDDLNDIEFNMKKATRVIRDITRGLLTDKCIGFLLLLVAAGVIVIIVLKVVKPNKNKIQDAVVDLCGQIVNAAGVSIPNPLCKAPPPAAVEVPPAPAAARRLLAKFVMDLLTEDDF